MCRRGRVTLTALNASTSLSRAIDPLLSSFAQSKTTGRLTAIARYGAGNRTAKGDNGMTSVLSDDDEEDARSGRKRPLWAVPAEEIRSRRDEWLPHLEGKTTAEIHRWAGFEGLPAATAEVWLWAVVHPALDLTCGPDGRWGLANGPQEVPAQLRSLVERWRASSDPE